jgi:anthranilate synthase component I
MTAPYSVQLPSDALLALHAAHPERYPALLQSAAPGEPLGRYDILLACPGQRLALHADGTLETDAGLELNGTFLEALDRWWRRERRPSAATLPFHGGWFLFLGYELAGQIEPVLALPRQGTVALAVRIPAALIVRHEDGSAWIVDEDGGRHVEQILVDIASLKPENEVRKPILAGRLQEEPADRYVHVVRRTLEHIAAGDIYQANLSRPWHGWLEEGVAPHDVYRSLRRANPAPFAALAVFDDFAIISSSPERLVESRGGMASTRPIAGTRPRYRDRGDEAVLRELHAHPKERAEHVMLIDLERNDLGRVCESGTVEVDEFMTLESYAHVHHIVSNIRGRLRGNVTPGELVAAVFPGGTITGCPKVRCMQIIAELEQAPRRAYTGSLGYLNRDGSMDLNILIRTLEMRGREIQFRAGAGIVADSIPERELEETRAKAQGLVNALDS